jgi:transcriptional regulator of acetoin/glycerol metabolism
MGHATFVNIQHMVPIGSESLIHTTDLPSALENHVEQKKSQYLMTAVGAQLTVPAANSTDSRAPSAVVPLAELEKRAILNALESTGGDRALAATLLGIGRTTLYRKLKEYKLSSD